MWVCSAGYDPETGPIAIKPPRRPWMRDKDDLFPVVSPYSHNRIAKYNGLLQDRVTPIALSANVSNDLLLIPC